MLVHKLLVDLAPPFVTAKSWSICDGRTGEILFGKCENDRKEIASLTKIMTAFVVILRLDPNRTQDKTECAVDHVVGFEKRCNRRRHQRQT